MPAGASAIQSLLVDIDDLCNAHAIDLFNVGVPVGQRLTAGNKLDDHLINVSIHVCHHSTADGIVLRGEGGGAGDHILLGFFQEGNDAVLLCAVHRLIIQLGDLILAQNERAGALCKGEGADGILGRQAVRFFIT